MSSLVPLLLLNSVFYPYGFSVYLPLSENPTLIENTDGINSLYREKRIKLKNTKFVAKVKKGSRVPSDSFELCVQVPVKAP